MCAFLYIQNSEAAIRGFLPKNPHRCRKKTERAQEIFESTHRLIDKMTKIHQLNSLSLLFSSLCGKILSRCYGLPRARPPTGGTTTVENPKGQICHVLQVTNGTSLGEGTQKVWRSGLLQWLVFLTTAQASVGFSPTTCCHGRRMIGQESVIHRALHLV